MPHRKVLFLPFEPTNLAAQGEYGNSQAGDNKNNRMLEDEQEKGNTVDVVWYTGKRSVFVAGMQEGQVYIRGHGMAGANCIEAGRGGGYVRYDEVVNRLVESGLPKTFRGKIKCYNCHSAESLNPAGNQDHHVFETYGTCFAQLVADAMYARGYKKCTFFGYVGSIDAFAKDGTSGKHKYVRGAAVKTSDGVWLRPELGRVSEFRHQFTPRATSQKPNFLGMLFGHM